MNVQALGAIAPVTTLTLAALIILVIESLFKKSERLSYWVCLLGLIAGIILGSKNVGNSGSVFNNMVTVGGLGSFFSTLFMISALLTVILARDFLRKTQSDFGAFYLLILLSTIGMILMATAADLIVTFLGLELMSICLYVLAGFLRTRMTSNEAAIKYFLLGAFATGFLLYGIALMYGTAGTTNIAIIVGSFSVLSSSMMFWMGVGLFLVGLAFKVGAVPFHMWIPDVYQGAPTPVAGFMSTGAKAAAFSALVIMFAHQIEGADKLRFIFSLLASASMILGNIVALAQSNIKRMLAYSSIAHAGYMLIGLAAGNQLGTSGIMFYLTAYTFINVGAFGVLSMLEREGEQNLDIDDYAGLGSRKPFIAAMMTIFMLSLAGIPPLAGFFGKYYIFVAAVNADLTWLAIVGVLSSVVSVYYYLRVVMVMYFREPGNEVAYGITPAGLAVLGVASLAILQFGLFPSSLLAVINSFF